MPRRSSFALMNFVGRRANIVNITYWICAHAHTFSWFSCTVPFIKNIRLPSSITYYVFNLILITSTYSCWYNSYFTCNVYLWYMPALDHRKVVLGAIAPTHQNYKLNDRLIKLYLRRYSTVFLDSIICFTKYKIYTCIVWILSTDKFCVK